MLYCHIAEGMHYIQAFHFMLDKANEYDETVISIFNNIVVEVDPGATVLSVSVAYFAKARIAAEIQGFGVVRSKSGSQFMDWGPVEDGVRRAAAVFIKAYGWAPNICYVNPSAIASEIEVEGIKVRKSASFDPMNYWAVWEPK